MKVFRNSILLEKPEDLLRAAAFLKSAPDFRMDYLASVTAVDYLKYLESVYHLYSIEKKTGPVVLRVRVPRKDPRIPSLVGLYRGAELQERENYDLFGIVYEGHPDLRRLFLWETFEGHPLRKDYVQEDSEVLEAADIEWLDRHGISSPKEVRQHALELRKQGKRAVAEKDGKEGA